MCFVAGVVIGLELVQVDRIHPKYPIRLLSDFRLLMVAYFNRQVPTKIPYLAKLWAYLAILEPLPLVYSIKLDVVLVLRFAEAFEW